ncbi:iron chaperone [Vagococcus elongatus]|uniref:Iron chaperone n=1 Tax=Vagococcus elongatus TaxID=180344 RepID=A0A430ALR1_9ENTE|nr:DUF1801 domain-containing protein [Vagococcus elongatus]RSU09061.1 iron chaperone [Vagococcus elongatus]
MNEFETIVNHIKHPDHRGQIKELFSWIEQSYPELVSVVKWNQPMYTAHGTYIIGFSFSKNHFAVSPETVTIKHFTADIEQAGYDHTQNIIRIKWGQAIDYSLIKKMIDFNITDKADHKNFWR